jgi:delta8-fatty-acid desaturase
MAISNKPRRQDRELPFITRREVEALIAEGRNIIILDGKVTKCDAWMPYHPGGDNAIRHMVGRDATDEVNAYVVQIRVNSRGLTPR